MLQPDPSLTAADSQPFIEFDPAAQASRTGSSTRLHGHKRAMAQLLWFVLILLSIITTIITVPPYFEKLRTAIPDANFEMLFSKPRQLFDTDVAALNSIGLSLDSYAAYMTVIWIVCAVAMLSASALLFWRRPDDRMAIYASITLGLFGVFNIGTPVNVLIDGSSAEVFFYIVLVDLTAISALTLCFIFPDGRYVPRWTRWIALGWGLYAYISDLLLPLPYRLADSTLLLFVILLNAVYGIGVYSLIYRFRYVATAVQRQQMKWVIYAYVVVFISTIGFALFVMIFIPSTQQPSLEHVFYNLLSQMLFVVSIIFWGWSLTISALRHRLWDVDLVINRSLVYGTLTVVLALLFVASAFIIRQVISQFTNSDTLSIAFAVSALLIGALFQPARRRMQQLVDRRFYNLLIHLEHRSRNHGSTTRPDTVSGTQLGAYEVRDLIGQGAMGEVYAGWQTALNRPVAIKVMSRQLADKAEFRARFLREARTAAMLSHPNIVHVFDFGQHEGMYYMVMDYVEGQSLSAVLQDGTRLSLNEAQALMKGVASALDYAHSKGIVHRDVKPSNIMLRPSKSKGMGPDWQPVLMDFGIAKIIGADTGLTGTGVVGTLDYLAPEQINASHAVDHRSDIFALGVILYEALTGELPFKGDNPAQVVYEHLNGTAPDPRQIIPDLSIGAVYAIQRAMSKQPEDRFVSAGALADAVR